jgi:16S rRNA (cytosine967-C5)-methyltransferase
MAKLSFPSDGEKMARFGRMKDSRTTAFLVVDRVLREQAYLHLLLRSSLARSQLSEQDKAFVTELAMGTVRMCKKLDHVISHFVDRPLEEIDQRALNLIRLGTYQLWEMHIPSHAAVYETVEIAKRLLGKGLASYVNAVLRSLSGETQRVKWPPREELMDFLSVVHSHPVWLVEYLIEHFGEERAEAICRSNNRRAPLSIRVNTMRHTVEEYADWLRNNEGNFTQSVFIPEGLTQVHMPGWLLLQEWEKGEFVVQDESSMLVSYILDPQPGEFIIDACSAPGGKTSHIAQLCGDRSEILAVDNQQKRIRSLERMVKNLGLHSVRLTLGDARELPEIAGRKADRVLVDAPCSGLGTLRRRPDIKWKRQREDIYQLASIQQEILDAAAAVLRKGGILVYSVCTITREETVEVIDRFLRAHDDFTLEEPLKFCPGEIPQPQEYPGFLFVFPDLHMIDGMFVARLKKM